MLTSTCATVSNEIPSYEAIRGRMALYILRSVDASAVAGYMSKRSLTRLPVMVIDRDVMEHLPRPNEDVYPAVSN